MAESISWRAAGHVWGRSVAIYRRTWTVNLLPNFFEPLIYLFGMGLGLGAYVQNIDGMSYLNYLAPGLVVANAMNGGTFETTYNLFIKLNYNRTYEAITATPINIEDAMVGELLWATTRALIYGGIFALVVCAFGWLPWLAGLYLLPVVVLSGWTFAALGMLTTSMLKTIDAFAFFQTLFITPMFLCSGIFFPLARMPALVQRLAVATPLYHAVNLSRAAALNQWQPGAIVDALYLVTLALMCSGYSILRIKRALVR